MVGINNKVGGVYYDMEVRGERALRDLDRNSQRVERSLDGAGRSADRLERNVQGVGRASTTSFAAGEAGARRYGTAVTNAQRRVSALRGTVSTLALGAVFVAGTSVLASFSQEMSTVEAVTGASADQVQRLREEAQRLGAETRFSATQAAEAQVFLARAGFDANEILGTLEGTLQLAQAGAIDLGSAADIASNVLQGFRLETAETGRVVDVLATAANSSNTDIRQLGDALKLVGPIAAGLGVQIEETTAAVGALSNAGLQSTLAGTGLRRVLAELESPATKTRKLFADLGVDVESVRPSVVGLSEALKVLTEANIDTGTAFEVFGQRGGPAFEVLASSIPDIERLTASLEESGGTAARVAEIMDQNLNGALLATRSRLEALIIALGDAGAEDAFIAALEGLNSLLTVAAENADIVGVAIIALSVRAILPFIGNLLLVNTQVRAAVTSFTLLTASTGPLTAGLTTAGLAVRGLGASLAALALNPLTLAIVAAATAFVALGRAAAEARENLADTASVLRDAREAVESFDDYMKTQRPLSEVGDQAEESLPAVERLIDRLGDLRSGIDAVTNSTRLQRALELQIERDRVQDEIDEIRRERERFIRSQANRAGRGASLPPSVAEAEFGPQFDQSERGDQLLQLRQQAGVLDNRIRQTAGDVEDTVDIFLDGMRGVVDNTDEVRAITAEINRLTEQRDAAERAGSQSTIDRFTRQLEIARETRALLEQGIDPETARLTARDRADERRTEAEAAKEIADIEERIAIARELGNQRGLDRAERELAFVRERNALIEQGLATEIAIETARDRVRERFGTSPTGSGDRGPASDIEREKERVAELTEDIATLEQAGADALVDSYREQLRISELTLANLEKGLSLAAARDLARADVSSPEDKAQAAIDARRQAVQAAELETNLRLEQARIEGDEKKIAALERQIELRQIFNSLLAVEEDPDDDKVREAAKVRAADLLNERLQARQRISQDSAREALDAYERELRITEARAAGEDEKLKALEREERIRQRIAQLTEAGLSESQARDRAVSDELRVSDAEDEGERRARRERLRDDIAGALSEGVRTGDYGEAFRNVIGTAAERALDEAINNVADAIAGLVTQLLNPQNGTGGLAALFNSGAGLTSQTVPPGLTAPAATQKATKTAANAPGAQQVSQLGQAAQVTAAALQGQMVASVISSATSNQAQAAASASTSAAVTQLGAAATGAAAQVQALGASSAAAGASGGGGGGGGIGGLFSSIFGGGSGGGGGSFLASIGSTLSNLAVPVAALAATSLLSRNNGGRKLDADPVRDTSTIMIDVTGATGNEEIKAMVRAGTEEAVRRANASAGPEAINFRERYA